LAVVVDVSHRNQGHLLHYAGDTNAVALIGRNNSGNSRSRTMPVEGKTIAVNSIVSHYVIHNSVFIIVFPVHAGPVTDRLLRNLGFINKNLAAKIFMIVIDAS
jgi:hypothetical protein